MSLGTPISPLPQPVDHPHHRRREVMFWHNYGSELVAGPGACPHLGGLSDNCPGIDGTMYCQSHGLALTQTGDQPWSLYRSV